MSGWRLPVCPGSGRPPDHRGNHPGLCAGPDAGRCSICEKCLRLTKAGLVGRHTRIGSWVEPDVMARRTLELMLA